MKTTRYYKAKKWERIILISQIIWNHHSKTKTRGLSLYFALQLIDTQSFGFIQSLKIKI